MIESPRRIALSLSVSCLCLCLSCALSSRARDGAGGETASYPDRPPATRLFDYAGFRDSANWGLLNGHDPSVLGDGGGGLWYAYSTDVQRGMLAEPGCQIRRSRDLVSWEFVGRALRDIPEEAAEWARPAGLWAPDCVLVDGEYRLYYSASSFGKQRSAIGLAVAPRPEGPFVPRGIVLRSGEGDPVNAIDPCIVLDRSSGERWMAYGSFWDGIRMLKLDSATGLVAPGQDRFGIPIARRASSALGAVEGAYIAYVERTRYYYLFVSYGSLYSDYNIRVARSASVTGPYLDREGRAMTDVSSPPDSVGFGITTGYRFGDRQGWMALGHNSAFERDGEWFLAHHARPEGGTSWPYLQVRRLFWTSDGWPVASPHPYSLEREQPLSVTDVAGSYDAVLFERTPAGVVTPSRPLSLAPSGTFATGSLRGRWKLVGGNVVSLSSSTWSAELIAVPSWDRDADMPAMALTGVDSRGLCVWGSSPRPSRAPTEPRDP